jgi:hypothetical protein
MKEAAGLAETFLSANVHVVFSHNSVTFTLTAVRISELTLKLLSTLFVAEFFLCRAGRIGVRSLAEERDFFPLYFQTSRSAVWGPQSLLLSGYLGFFRVGKSTGA